MELITGYKGQAHVTAAQTGATNAGVMGTGKYILAVGGEMAAAIVDNNHVSIANGYGINQGRYFFTNGETLTIATGTTGTKREDLIVARYEKVASGVESASLKVIKGTSGNAYVTPSYTSGNILGGDYVDEMPLFKVHLNGAEIVDIVRVSEVKEKADKSTTLEGYGITNAVSHNNLAAYSGGSTWEGGHSYALNDIVLYSNVAYICKVAHSSSTTNTPGTAGGATYWNVISLGTLNTSLANLKYGKLLWNGSFINGSITIPNGANYKFFVVIVGYMPCFGTKDYGIGGALGYGAYSIDKRGYRVSASISGDDLIWTIDSINRGGTNGTSNETIQTIYGLC